MDSISPVWTEQEVELEKIVALDQEEYIPIVVLPILWADGVQGMSVRFRLTETERKSLASGADLIITELTFSNQFTPLHLKICNPNERPFD